MNNAFDLQNLIDTLSYSKKIHISIHYLTGAYQQDPTLIVQPANKVHYCKFCNEAKTTKRGLALCMRNKYLSINKAFNKKYQFIGKCYLGITEIVTPVFIKDTLFCIVYIGNILIKEDIVKIMDQIHYASHITHVKSNLVDLIDELENISARSLDDYIKIANTLSGCIHLILEAHKSLFQGKRSAITINTTHWLIQQAVEYIEQFYNTDIKLTHISNLFFVNAQYLSRLFSKNMGVTFVEYIHLTRIKEAKKLLMETNNKIIDIAYKVGFNNVTYFNLVFKKNTGLTPFEFRKAHI
jgi:YesN/AraC family two-component response regulator